MTDIVEERAEILGKFPSEQDGKRDGQEAE
jgi:hypothetical protein